ncbi:MAG: 7-carboxy-7-deazaguanine synthase [Saprospiraceae bacterium]|uniref:7-carboxy-7-deazaguanine synthase n=1 Tax=Candidatus Opimibacter skivensis TaxID=2982028 RepID=A0A9D7XMG0_9BACT|nr:7-carboxy-7-deazaguanine synthase [Candidatus Opimibacter skivensis]
MSSYKVKEIYYTLQGEGARTGRPSVFLRFTGCNLWSGREEDRSEAICKFCDTDFIGMDGVLGGKYDALTLASKVNELWPSDQGRKYVVCTGGEPLLQIDEELIQALHQYGFEIGIETNGTIIVPKGIDWICVSPKANTEVVVKKGSELKLVVRQHGIDPKMFETWDFDNFYLQPMDGPYLKEFTEWAMDYCLQHPQWRLSIQTHKLLGIR